MLHIALIITLVLAAAAATVNQFPFQDVSLPWDKRVDDLVHRLTLEELVNDTMALYGRPPVGVPRLGIQPYQLITECLHGYVGKNATAFPQALGLAAAFSRELLFNISTAISYEVRAFYNEDRKRGIYGRNGLSCFSPVINIMRHPLWGRNQETYGEDPFLSGELVSEYVKGLQGDDARYVRANAGCKHFDAHGGPENIPVSRHEFDAKVSERDLRMTFLPQFKSCIKAGSYNVMCSYNSVNGVPACANKKLLTDVLRNEWGFLGFVISDDQAIEFIVEHHKYVKTLEEAAAASIKAGCNVELGDGSRKHLAYAAIPSAIQKGLLSADEFLESMKPVYYTRMRLGEFDPAQMNPFSSIDMSMVLSPAHHEQAIQAASMSFVLLKNIKGYLPFKKQFSRLAIVGPMADNAEELLGGYSASPDRRFVSTPLDGLKQLGKTGAYASGCDNARCLNYDGDSVRTAVKGASFIIVCLGTGSSVEGESNDRTELALPGKQLQLLKDSIFYSREAPLLLLVFSGGPVDLTFAHESPEVDAIIQCYFPGQATGTALYRTLTATGPHSIPAGRLPSTWPAQLHQVAPITDYNMTHSQTYRYFYEDPLYPFGYGLSYSKFHYDNVSVEPSTVKAGDSVTVTVEVNNKGPYDAEEVVQVYLAWTTSKVPVPKWTLVGFERPFIKVNTPVTLSFTVTSEQMAVWMDDKTGFAIQPGSMTVYIGGQQPNQRVNVGSNHLQANFTITS